MAFRDQKKLLVLINTVLNIIVKENNKENVSMWLQTHSSGWVLDGPEPGLYLYILRAAMTEPSGSFHI